MGEVCVMRRCMRVMPDKEVCVMGGVSLFSLSVCMHPKNSLSDFSRDVCHRSLCLPACTPSILSTAYSLSFTPCLSPPISMRILRVRLRKCVGKNTGQRERVCLRASCCWFLLQALSCPQQSFLCNLVPQWESCASTQHLHSWGRSLRCKPYTLRTQLQVYAPCCQGSSIMTMAAASCTTSLVAR